MKRKFISTIIIAVAALCSFSAGAEFRYGPVAGVNISDLHFTQDFFNVDKSVGYSVGVMGELMFPGIGFGIDLGLMYDQRGATMNLGQGNNVLWQSQGYGVARSYLHYLNIPLHLRFKYTRLNGFEDTLAPFIYAGPSIGFLVGHNKIDCMDYATGEVGVDMGIGAEIIRKWQVSLSFNLGFTQAFKDRTLTDFEAYNRTWAVRVAYLF